MAEGRRRGSALSRARGNRGRRFFVRRTRRGIGVPSGGSWEGLTLEPGTIWWSYRAESFTTGLFGHPSLRGPNCVLHVGGFVYIEENMLHTQVCNKRTPHPAEVLAPSKWLMQIRSVEPITARRGHPGIRTSGGSEHDASHL